MPPLVPTSALYSARPRLRLDGRDAPGLVDGLLSLVVEETTAGLYRCEAVFGNWGTKGGGPGFLFFDRGTFDFGKPLEVDMGDGQAAAKVFTGKITGLEARFPEGRPPELTVLAEDRLQDLRMTRRSRTFEDSSDADVARWIASKHGLRTQVDLDGPTHAVLAQVNQSDLAFLRERARAADGEVWVEGDTLHAQARARRNAGQVSLEYGRTLREFSVLADLAGQRTSLTVSGWDVAAKEGIAGDAAESAVQSELSGGDSGGKILKSAFGDRPERIVHLVSLTPGEADGLAKARFRGMARRFLTGQGISDGDARIRVGTRVDLKSIGPLFEGEYYVTEVRQTFDAAHGYRTRFAVERPNLGEALSMPVAEVLDELLDARVSRGFGGLFYGVYAGVVSDISDPQGQGRVKVKLPWSPDGDGQAYEAWARLATLMAGNNRGSWFVPDVGDEVLLAFEAGDPRRPYVVGSLWNGQDAPPQSMDGAGRNPVKLLRSRNGVKITLDDSDGREVLKLETPGGHVVLLDDGARSVEVRDSNGNQIKAAPEGVSITTSAKATVTASTVEISAGMVTVNAGMSKFSGVVQADTVITNSVVSASYTPGAGNIW